MLSVCRHSLLMQGKFTFLAAILFSVSMASAQEAKTEKEMKPYTEKILNTDVTFDMVPIPGGEFLMGSPDSEKNREDDEGPQVKVKIEPFWMGKHEVTWNEYDIWSFNLDIQRRKLMRGKYDEKEKAADAVTRPTKPYTDMTFDMGHDGYPAICMTQLAAKTYCKWLSEKTVMTPTRKSDRKNRIPGACMTFTATFRSGSSINTFPMLIKNGAVRGR